MENIVFCEVIDSLLKSMIPSFSNRGEFWQSDSSNAKIKGSFFLSLLD